MSTTGHLPELESLRSQVAALARELAERDRSMRTQHRHMEQAMQDLREQSGLLRAIVEGTAADTGEEFFRSLVRHLAQALNVRYALIGEWYQEYPDVVRTLAVWSGTAIAEPFEYHLQHTPCANVVGQRSCLYESGVRQLFPEDHLLAQMNVESYCGTPLFDRSGRPLGLLVVMDDRPMTRSPSVKDLLQIFAARAGAELQRRQAEETLLHQQRRFADAQSLAHLGSWDWDIDSGEVQWSDEHYRIFGHEPRTIEVTYDTFLAALLPDDHDRVLAAMNDALLNKAPYDTECRIVRPSGEVRHIHCRGEVCRNGTGNPIRMSGTALDVTERVRIEEALRAGEERWQLAIRGSNDGIWDWKIRSGDIFFSTRWKAMRGFADHEIGNHIDEWRSRIHSDDLDRVLHSIDAYLAKQTREFSEEYRVQRKDGSYMWILDRGVALWDEDGMPIRMVGSESDISERKRSEEALRQSEARFAAFMAHLPGIAFMKDAAGRHIYVNEGFERLLGTSNRDWHLKTNEELFPPEVADRFTRNDQMLERQEQPVEVTETTISGNETRSWLVKKFLVTYEPNSPALLGGIAIDITARKQAEGEQTRLLTELAESQKHFEQIFHWTPSAVAISTLAEGRFLDVNERLVQLTGYSREELIGHTTAELRLWADPPERARVIQEILQQGALHNKEGLLRTKSGDIRAIMVSADRIQVKGTPCLIYVAHDITERKQAETMRARQYEALQTVFRMTVALSRASSLEELYEQGIDGVRRALKVDRAAILLFDDDGVMRFTASQGLSDRYRKAVEGHSPWSREAVAPSPICVSDIEEDSSLEAYRDIVRAEGIRALGFIPLTSSDGLLGKFMLYFDAPHRLLEEEIQVAQTIAGTIAFMIQRKRAEERLVTSERRLRTVLDTLPIGVWFTDRSGKTLLANPAAKQIWSNIKQVGLQTPNNPSGWWEPLEPAGEPHRWALSHVLTKGVSSLNESLDLECLDGARKTIRNTAVPVQNEAGDVVGAIVLNEDITLLRQAQEALRLTQFSVDHAVEGFFWIGADARILTVNDAACRMLEYSREELLAMTVHDIDPLFPPERWSVHWQELKQKGSLTIESKQWSKTGRVVDAEITISYLQYAGREYHCAIMRDITERKRVEETLRQRECDLQAAVEERERISEDLHDGILQSLYAVGLGLEACQSLLLVQPQQSPRQRKKTAKAVGQALDQAVDQLNAVMCEVRNFIAGLQSQVLQGEDFPTVLRTMVQTLTASQPMRCRLMIDQRASRRVSTEQALHLLHVVREALSNSLRHGHATRATVSFKLLTRSARLLVTDNGRGFHPDHARGIGHGLANMAARAHRMGGRFAVQSRPKQGTRITIDLPREEAYARG